MIPKSHTKQGIQNTKPLIKQHHDTMASIITEHWGVRKTELSLHGRWAFPTCVISSVQLSIIWHGVFMMDNSLPLAVHPCMKQKHVINRLLWL